MQPSGIYAILDTDRLGLTDHQALSSATAQLVGYAVAAVQGGAIAVQLRCKALPVPDPLRAELAVALAEALRHCGGGTTPLVVDDDLEAAVAAGCGLHWGQSDGDPRAARQRLGPHALLGWSTHDLAQVDAAQANGANYLGFGPVRPTLSKQRAERPTGWAALTDAAVRSQLPLVAIGGLELADVPLVRAAGAHAMATIGAWLGPTGAPWPAGQAYAAMQTLHLAWQQAGPNEG